jgi:hypothetical protein
VFRTAALDMDVLYRADQTHQVEAPAHPIACVTKINVTCITQTLVRKNYWLVIFCQKFCRS